MQWSDYVRSIIGTDRQVDVAEKTGIDQTTISRWLNLGPDKGRRITSQSVAALARAYGRPVIEAFVAAGFLTEDEAGQPLLADASTLTTADLLAELARRVRSA